MENKGEFKNPKLAKELRRIRKTYGEEMMHLCREKFQKILQSEGLLLRLLKENFATNSRNLGRDIKAGGEEKIALFVDYIFSLAELEMIRKEGADTDKTPEELLDEVGYDLYECTSDSFARRGDPKEYDTKKDVQYFLKYYKPGDELCTFADDRLRKALVFFAVRRDAGKVKIKYPPDRDDDYGRSVLGIQFSKPTFCGADNVSRLSIKSRHNHAVQYPDNALGGDLDIIAAGLTKSFQKKLWKEHGYRFNYGIDIPDFNLPGYMRANDRKIL